MLEQVAAYKNLNAHVATGKIDHNFILGFVSSHTSARMKNGSLVGDFVTFEGSSEVIKTANHLHQAPEGVRIVIREHNINIHAIKNHGYWEVVKNATRGQTQMSKTVQYVNLTKENLIVKEGVEVHPVPEFIRRAVYRDIDTQHVSPERKAINITSLLQTMGIYGDKNVKFYVGAGDNAVAGYTRFRQAMRKRGYIAVTKAV